MTLQENFKTALEDYGMGEADFKGRHPSTLHMLKVLAPDPNLKGKLLDITRDFWATALDVVAQTPDGPELTAGLRKLLEAKDCFVRAALDGVPVDYRDR